jgi:DNA-binding LacI/PurR family transcriptional regulator
LLVGDIINSVNFEIILGGEAAAGDGGYTMVLADAQESPRTEREAIQRVVATVEGLVLSSSRISDSAIRSAARQRPMVIVNRAFPEVPCLDRPRWRDAARGRAPRRAGPFVVDVPGRAGGVVGRRDALGSDEGGRP